MTCTVPRVQKSSDDGVWHSELLGFWTLSIVWDEELEHDVSEIGNISVLW
jgi:hypothetical protein